MASGNQVCNPNWALLPIAANNSNSPMIVRTDSFMNGDRLNTVL
jgi:hypothetical protein